MSDGRCRQTGKTVAPASSFSFDLIKILGIFFYLTAFKPPAIGGILLEGLLVSTPINSYLYTNIKGTIRL